MDGDRLLPCKFFLNILKKKILNFIFLFSPWIILTYIFPFFYFQSGSASPVSLHNATTSNCNITTTSLPEGFVRPPIDNQKSFLLQSFTIRTVSSEGDSTTSTSQSPLPEELVAYLPVRSMLLEPLKLTLELRPNPQNTDSLIRDQQHQHLENQKPILRKMENFEMCDNNSYGAGNEVVPSSVP